MSPEFQKPRTNFTFFPDQAEQDRIINADIDDVKAFTIAQLDMMPQFFHELWRNGRETNIYEVSKYLNGLGIPPIINLIMNNPSTLVALMNGIHGEDLSTCKAFLQETCTLAQKATLGISQDSLLDNKNTVYVSDIVNAIMSDASVLISRYKAKQN